MKNEDIKELKRSNAPHSKVAVWEHELQIAKDSFDFWKNQISIGLSESLRIKYKNEILMAKSYTARYQRKITYYKTLIRKELEKLRT